MSWFGCYSLDLYCDNWSGKYDEVHGWGNHFPAQFTDELGSRARADARKAGWIIKRDGTAICPKCSGKTRTPLVSGDSEANKEKG